MNSTPSRNSKDIADAYMAPKPPEGSFIEDALLEINACQAEINVLEKDSSLCEFYKWFKIYDIIPLANLNEKYTYTPEEADAFFRKGTVHPAKDMCNTDILQNLLNAYDYVLELPNSQPLTEKTLRALYAALDPRALVDSTQSAYRKTLIRVPASPHYLHAPHPDQIPELMANFFENLHGKYKNIHPFKLAVWAQLELLHIWPFPRYQIELAKLVATSILLQHGYSRSFISTKYTEEYITCEQVYRATGQSSAFYALMAKKYLEGQRGFVRFLAA